MSETHKKIIAENRKARHDYFIVDQFEVGMVLKGTEMKSIRLGRANLKDSYARIKKGEVFVYQMHISEYPFAYHDNHDPLRPRKLLLHNYEIKKLCGSVNEKGMSMVPTHLYLINGKAKMTLALVKGKRKYDKRAAIKKRDQKRDFDREKNGS